MCLRTNVLWRSSPRMHQSRGHHARLDARSWSRSHSTPCFALPLCAPLAAQRLSLLHFAFPHTDTSTRRLLCVREKLLAPRAPGRNCLPPKDLCKLGVIGSRRVLFSYRGGKTRSFCNEVDVPEPKVRSSSFLFLFFIMSIWISCSPETTSQSAPWISWFLTELKGYFPVKHWCMRCGDRKSPYVLCRCCCPCHLLVKAKRGAVARLGKLITLKGSASSMYLIRKYQVGEIDKWFLHPLSPLSLIFHHVLWLAPPPKSNIWRWLPLTNNLNNVSL